MRSPFPGMDPFIESQGLWQDFHASVITYCRDALADVLPDHYVAQIDERLHLVSFSSEKTAAIRPDVLIARDDRPTPPTTPAGAVGVATLEPVTIPYAEGDEEVRETWIEIRRLPDLVLVTTVEVLSPSNKAGPGRDAYLNKRLALIGKPVHLVEIDLLLDGRRPPMRRPLPAGDYYAIVARADRRPDCDVYAWSIRQPLPPIPIPLSAPDPDVPLDLAAVVAAAYERGRYGRFLKYDAPMDLPLAPDDRAWAEETARTR